MTQLDNPARTGLRAPRDADGWALWAGVAVLARLAYVFLADHLAGTAGALPATPAPEAPAGPAEALMSGAPTPRERSPRKPGATATGGEHRRRLPGLLAAAHRPPQRVRGFWHPFDMANGARMRAARRAGRWVLEGLDANEGNPEELARAAGLTWHSTDPKRIDGFLASDEVTFHQITPLPKNTSDHQPLLAAVEIGGVRLTVADCNDDWASAGSNFDEIRHADVMLIQEGKRAHYRRLAGPEFVVRQSWLNLGRAGSVIIIRKAAPLKLGGFGWTFGVAAAGLLPRWICWQRCAVIR